MTILYQEMAQRFPEIQDRILPDANEPYLMMNGLATWLEKLEPKQLTQELIARVISFAHWCEEQPRKEDASNDLFTILYVGFYEDLFKSDRTRELLPKLIPRDDIIGNEDYLKTWVGEDNYAKALAQYDSKAS